MCQSINQSINHYEMCIIKDRKNQNIFTKSKHVILGLSLGQAEFEDIKGVMKVEEERTTQ